MKKRNVRIFSLTVAATLLSVILGGCSSSSKTSSQGKKEELKPVELSMYCIGDEPKDLQLIQDKINEMSKKDINTTVKISFTSWTDYSTKYNLLLSTGQPIDLIYTANWLDYAKLARKGAFKPLDDLLAKVTPNIKKSISDNYWNQVKVDGKVYTIPATWAEYSTNGFQYRADLQKKYNLPVPNSLENVEKYFDGIKKNLPNQTLTNLYVNAGISTQSFTSVGVLPMKYGWAGEPVYGVVANYDNPSQPYLYWGSKEFTEDMKMMKRWADKGFWSKSALSNKNDTTLFDNGKTVAVFAGQNASKYGAAVNNALTAHPDWEIGYVAYAETTGVATIAHATQNGTAIPASASNPERALMFYEKLLLDKTYNQLSEYGILGTHYNIKDGYYEGIGDPTKATFPREGLNGWAWRNTEYMLFPKSFDIVKNTFAKFDTIAAKSKFKGTNISGGFQEDFTPYQTERAALGTVMTQYLAPLQAGLVDNVDDAIKTFMDKAKAAGLEKIQAEYIKQWKAYCGQYNYK